MISNISALRHTTLLDMTEARDIIDIKEPEVFRTHDDGYIVRGMTLNDAKIVQEWFLDMRAISRYDLDVTLRSFPPGRGFYIGELDGVVVSSCVRLPWGDGAYYGGYYYVHKDYRGKGYGTRLRDEVAYGHVVEAGGKLCVDAVAGAVAKKNAAKFQYVDAFKTRKLRGEAKDFGASYTGTIVSASSVSFDELIAYDNKNFVSKDYPPRRKFLEEWIRVPGGAAVVALNGNAKLVGFGQRRPAMQEKNHLVGPVYADDVTIAGAIFQELCSDIRGDTITTDVWVPNEKALQLLESMGLTTVLDVHRMHANGDPNEYKPTVFGLTNIDTCGF